MPLYRYRCARGHESEALRKVGTDSIACGCGDAAQRQSVYTVAATIGAEADWTPLVRDNGRIRTPVSDRMVNIRQYREAAEQIAYEQRTAEAAVGMNLPQAPLMEMAKAKVAKLKRAGITDSKDMPKGLI